MTLDPKPLMDNAVDVAATVTEEFLNRFSTAHHKAGNDIYHGTYPIPEFSPRLDVKYDVEQPLLFDISPIPMERFAPLWLAHLRAKGASKLVSVLETPPNIKLSCGGFRFTFIVYKKDSPEVDFQVDFVWSFEARCAVQLEESTGGGKAIRLEPIKVTFSKPMAEIGEEVRTRFQGILAERKTDSSCAGTMSLGISAADEPVWCMELERLILFIVNQVLALQASNFIRSWELPRAFELVEGIGLAPTYLALDANSIVVGGKVAPTTSGVSPVAYEIASFLAEFDRRISDEFSTMTDDEFKSWKPETSQTTKWVTEIEDEMKATLEKRKLPPQTAMGKNYPENIQILSNDVLFNSLARHYLQLHQENSGERKLDFLVAGRYRWWIHMVNGRANVVQAGVHAAADLVLGASIGLAHPNPDPKHWGDWLWYDFGVQLEPRPEFGVNAFLSFETNGVFLQGECTTESIRVTIPGFPGWANDLLGWITEQLSRPLVAVLKLFIAALHVRIIRYPEYFPGTPLRISQENWRFNHSLGNIGPYLTVSADTKF